jgi:mannose-6-phosphate isomerase-like protein (cupin superfamily)
VAGEDSNIRAAHYVCAGRDRFRGQREIRLTRTLIDIKVSTLDTDGALSVAEITSLHKGGPARHLHHDEQDEWFYVLEGEYVISRSARSATSREQGTACSLRARWRTRGPTSGRGQEG